MKAIYKVLMVLAIPTFLVLYSFSEGSPGGKTGSPGDNGSNCTGCHKGNDVQNVGDWIMSDIPEGGYIPGNIYAITASGTQEAVGAFGFEITSENEAGVKKGEFTVTDEERTQRVSSNAVTHTLEGTKPTGDEVEWTMKWTAPEAGTGQVRFYAAINAANGNGNNGGDQIYLTMLSVDEDVSISVAENLWKDQLNMYPNPSNAIVNLNLPEGADYYLIDMLGNQIESKKNVGSKETIDISEFDNGVYFVQVIHNGESYTSRLLKN